MRIAFFGSSLLSSYWNGAATYYRGLLKQLARRGHRITFYEPDAYDRQAHRDIDPPSWARVVVFEATEKGALRALREAADADLLVKASGIGVLDELIAAELLSVRRPGALAALWDVDAPATLEELARTPDHPLRALLPAYDIVFTYGGGARVVEAYRQLGAAECIVIYNALDPETHHPVPRKSVHRCDLLFVGNRLPDREARVEELFVRPAAALGDRRFVLGGSGWQHGGLPGNVQLLGHVPTGMHNVLNASALAVLNITRDSMVRCGFSPPTRLFEAAGAGACVITDRWEGIEHFLEPGSEVLVVSDEADVVDELCALSWNRAFAVGDAARRRLLAEHTYARRALLVEQALDGRAVSAVADASDAELAS